MPAVSIDSATAGPGVLELRFYRTATSVALDHVTSGSRHDSIGGTADSLGHLRLVVPRAGRVVLRSMRLGYRPRLDTITIAADSVLWLRIGMARSFVDAPRCLGVIVVRSVWRSGHGAGAGHTHPPSGVNEVAGP